MLDRYLPYTLITAHNPVFDYDLRRVPRSFRPQALKTTSLLVVGIVLLISFIIWLLVPAQFLGLILIAAIGAFFVTNLCYLIASVHAIYKLKISGDWDLLRLTPISLKDLATAKHMIVQVRVWPIMMIDLALRLAALFTLLTYAIADERIQLFISPFSFIGILVLILGSLAEPLWRMRAITATGIRVAVQKQALPMAIIAGITNTICLYLLLAGLAVSVAFCTYVVAPGELDDLGMNIGRLIAGIFMVVFCWAFYTFFRQCWEDLPSKAISPVEF